MLFISSKKLFLPPGIQIFIFPSSPLFLPIRHCFRGWLKINLYDVISCQNKSLITHFLWYFEKDERHDIKALSIDRVLNIIRDILQKMCMAHLANNLKKSMHARNSFKKKIFWKTVIKKTKNQVRSNGQDYKKKEPGTSNQSLLRLQNKFRIFPLLVMYYLTKFDDVI